MTWMILPDAERPSAIEVADAGMAGYTRLVADDSGRIVEWREERLEMVGHVPCGWEHPSWHDENERRFQRHLTTCEMRAKEDPS